MRAPLVLTFHRGEYIFPSRDGEVQARRWLGRADKRLPHARERSEGTCEVLHVRKDASPSPGSAFFSGASAFPKKGSGATVGPF
jgi:hypothetical protein